VAVRSTQRLPPNGSQVTYRYAGDTVSGMLHAAADTQPRTFQVILTEPAWEPLAPVSVLLPLEHLENGAVIRNPVWNQTGPGGDVTWRVTRIDSVGTVAVGDGRTIEAWHLTATVAAVANTVFRLAQTPKAPYYWWFAVDRPGLSREWTLVHWQALAR
jgi:hypothetical protein